MRVSRLTRQSKWVTGVCRRYGQGIRATHLERVVAAVWRNIKTEEVVQDRPVDGLPDYLIVAAGRGRCSIIDTRTAEVVWEDLTVDEALTLLEGGDR